MDLKGKTAIVTGAGRGIGQGIALALARQGANVVVNARTVGNAAATVAKITAAGGSAMGFGADVTRPDQIAAMVAATVKQFGTVDILVNNAGIEATPCPLKDLPEEQWDRIITTNLKSVFLCIKAVLPTMIAQNKGKIVNIGSLAGVRMTFFGGPDYTTSKAGVIGLSRHLAWELAEHRINVNVVNPGAVLTPLAEEASTPEYREMVTKRLIPLGRWCTPEDIGETVVFLSSPASDLITGQCIEVDGGVMTGYGEDLRPIIKQRMEDMKAEAHH